MLKENIFENKLKYYFGDNNVVFVDNKNDVPLLIKGYYNIKTYKILGNKISFLIVKDEKSFNLYAYKSHLKLLMMDIHNPIALYISKLNTHQRKSMMERKIMFLTNEGQLYLPCISTIIDEKKEKKQIDVIEFSPKTQLLAVFFFYNLDKEFMVDDLKNKLKMNNMSVSRATKDLVAIKAISIKKIGLKIIYFSKLNKKNYYNLIKDKLSSPIKKAIKINESNKTYLKAGLSALAHYSMLNEDKTITYATYDIVKNVTNCNLFSNKTLEIWKYDPKLLSNTQFVDKLSLLLSLKNQYNDERVAYEIKMLEKGLFNEERN